MLENYIKRLEDLEAILNTEDGQARFLLAGLVVEAAERGLLLESGQCYDFAISPALGGELDIDNVEVQEFIVAVNIAGQIHEQIKDLPDGTPIWREIHGSTAYMTAQPKTVHAGIGKAAAVSAEITWPNGTVLKVDSLNANAEYRITMN